MEHFYRFYRVLSQVTLLGSYFFLTSRSMVPLFVLSQECLAIWGFFVVLYKLRDCLFYFCEKCH